MTKPKDTGAMLSDQRLADVTTRLCALLDDEGLMPHNQVFALAHAYSACANALGVQLADAQTLIRTRYAAAERAIEDMPADLRARWNEIRKLQKP